jgi:hypothetical protein
VHRLIRLMHNVPRILRARWGVAPLSMMLGSICPLGIFGNNIFGDREFGGGGRGSRDVGLGAGIREMAVGSI